MDDTAFHVILRVKFKETVPPEFLATLYDNVRVDDLVLQEAPVYINRHDRRVLERRRRKHDKFVIPQGPQPAPVTSRLPQAAKSKPTLKPVVELPDPDPVIAGPHHEDSENVLYAETELYGEFNFRDTILQQLDRYFVYLARMKHHDQDSYALYRQIGATLLPYVDIGAHDVENNFGNETWSHQNDSAIKLADWFNHKRPSFGCFVYGANPEIERYELERKLPGKNVDLWVPKFMYYTKYKQPPPELQPMSGGDIYKLTVWWDRPLDPKYQRKHGTPQTFGIFISQDGTQVVALRQVETKALSIATRRPRVLSNGYREKSFTIPQRAWRYPDAYKEWAEQHGMNVQEYLTQLFLLSVQKQEFAQYSMVRVMVAKDDMVATFGVNVQRMAYFFQDRDISLTEDGLRKRVFHIVRPHVRSDGTVVKMHFRGERVFTWAGYRVSITVPGRDHPDLIELDIGCEDEYWLDKKEKDSSIGMEALGKRLADSLKYGG